MNDYGKAMKEAQERRFLITVNGVDYDVRNVSDWEISEENSDEITLWFNDGTQITFDKVEELESGEVILDQLIDCL